MFSATPPPEQALLRTYHRPGDVAAAICYWEQVCVGGTLKSSRGSGWDSLLSCSADQHSPGPRPWRSVTARGSPDLSSTGGLQALRSAPGGFQGRNWSNHRAHITVLSLRSLPLVPDVLCLKISFHIFCLFTFCFIWFLFSWLF